MDISVNYKLSKKELLVFSFLQSLRNLKSSLNVILFVALGVQALAGWIGLDWRASFLATVVFIATILPIRLLLVFLNNAYLNFVLGRKLHPILFGETAIKFDKATVSINAGSSESKINWNDFLTVSSNSRFLLLWLSSNSVTIIPWRVFSPEQKMQLLPFVRV